MIISILGSNKICLTTIETTEITVTIHNFDCNDNHSSEISPVDDGDFQTILTKASSNNQTYPIGRDNFVPHSG